ncbi:MAG: hypothetical protein H0V07_13240 [Propionibacteriales bacterium]|nr:hypothetical protein [Propionibacteriales bacterium]
MPTRISIACACLALACMPAALPAQAAVSGAGASSVAVRIAPHRTAINADGTVEVVMRIQCKDGYNVFEIDTSVVQPDAQGSSTEIGPFLAPCDGKKHRRVVEVAPSSGTFHLGAATLSVFVGVFDGRSDLQATDEVTVRLYAR